MRHWHCPEHGCITVPRGLRDGDALTGAKGGSSVVGSSVEPSWGGSKAESSWVLFREGFGCLPSSRNGASPHKGALFRMLAVPGAELVARSLVAPFPCQVLLPSQNIAEERSKTVFASWATTVTAKCHCHTAELAMPTCLVMWRPPGTHPGLLAQAGPEPSPGGVQGPRAGPGALGANIPANILAEQKETLPPARCHRGLQWGAVLPPTAHPKAWGLQCCYHPHILTRTSSQQHPCAHPR